MKNAQLLNQCTPGMRDLFWRVEQTVQVEILPSTIRKKNEQASFVASGTSQTLDSKHLIVPGVREFSQAVDAGPYPMVWPKSTNELKVLIEVGDAAAVIKWVDNYRMDWGRLYYFAGVVKQAAYEMRLPIRQGVDWNGNFILSDQQFNDAVHTEEI